MRALLLFALFFCSSRLREVLSSHADPDLVEAWIRARLRPDPDDPYFAVRGAKDRTCDASSLEEARARNRSIRAHEFANGRYRDIEQNLRLCPRQYYIPRQLSVSQISWKARPPPSKQQHAAAGTAPRREVSYGNCTQEEEGLNSTISASSNAALVDHNVTNPVGEGINVTCKNGTWVSLVPSLMDLEASLLKNGSSGLDNGARKTQSSNNSHEVVHNFLLFGLLLPNHPFSSDLLEALITVTPLFPEVNVVIGSASEFSEFCSQYNVRAFPKLLFFKQGLLKHKYKRLHNPWELARELSRWTGSLPRGLPFTDPLTPFKWIVPRDGARVGGNPNGLFDRLGITVTSFVNRSSSSSSGSPSPSPSSSSSSYSTKSRLQRALDIITRRSHEPFSEFGVKNDALLMSLAGVFVVSRALSRVFS